ncbi:MAG: AmmeMemoRadiSam system radical SAM enzyme, partial [Syntrophomonadaceae bacterium]|nr:AmmeMemoRadiSam system radical SAM enzyme [Syntrophomonadaceae bacterium]
MTDNMREALWYEKLSAARVRCELCPHRCVLADGKRGRCRARVNAGGVMYADGYGQITALALDPIEKKPLYRFHPGSMILSLGGAGCNMSCPFCQNHHLSAAVPPYRAMLPEQIAELAGELTPQGNIGVAYTYNEPLINYEYLLDTAAKVHAAGLKNVAVTNGLINTAPLLKLLPHLDAMNIDLKCFSAESYRKLGGDWQAVKEVIALSAGHCHVEVTTLIIPGFNDKPEDMRAQCSWLADAIGDWIPLHLSRFFPRHLMSGGHPTALDTLQD